jgi:RimJ/RimL family protein N-acetyltransferase
VRIRPIQAGDATALEAFYAGLSVDSRISRFLGATPTRDRARAAGFCTADHEHREGFVAVIGAADDERVIGHICIEPDAIGSAEVAIAVADADQGQGIGHRLLDAAVTWARRAGLHRLDATAFVSNAGIIRLFRGLGLPVRVEWTGGSVCELFVDLRADQVAA